VVRNRPERASAFGRGAHGFDDIFDAAHGSSPVTTVHQDFAEVDLPSLKLLFGQMSSGARSGEQVVSPSELVVRQDSASPAPAPTGAWP
jgi:DNA-binding LacI/PurR family transcriptional regulator